MGHDARVGPHVDGDDVLDAGIEGVGPLLQDDRRRAAAVDAHLEPAVVEDRLSVLAAHQVGHGPVGDREGARRGRGRGEGEPEEVLHLGVLTVEVAVVDGDRLADHLEPPGGVVGVGRPGVGVLAVLHLDLVRVVGAHGALRLHRDDGGGPGGLVLGVGLGALHIVLVGDVAHGDVVAVAGRSVEHVQGAVEARRVEVVDHLGLPAARLAGHGRGGVGRGVGGALLDRDGGAGRGLHGLLGERHRLAHGLAVDEHLERPGGGFAGHGGPLGAAQGEGQAEAVAGLGVGLLHQLVAAVVGQAHPGGPVGLGDLDHRRHRRHARPAGDAVAPVVLHEARLFGELLGDELKAEGAGVGRHLPVVDRGAPRQWAAPLAVVGLIAHLELGGVREQLAVGLEGRGVDGLLIRDREGLEGQAVVGLLKPGEVLLLLVGELVDVDVDVALEGGALGAAHLLDVHGLDVVLDAVVVEVGHGDRHVLARGGGRQPQIEPSVVEVGGRPVSLDLVVDLELPLGHRHGLVLGLVELAREVDGKHLHLVGVGQGAAQGLDVVPALHPLGVEGGVADALEHGRVGAVGAVLDHDGAAGDDGVALGRAHGVHGGFGGGLVAHRGDDGATGHLDDVVQVGRRAVGAALADGVAVVRGDGVDEATVDVDVAGHGEVGVVPAALQRAAVEGGPPHRHVEERVAVGVDVLRLVSRDHDGIRLGGAPVVAGHVVVAEAGADGGAAGASLGGDAAAVEDGHGAGAGRAATDGGPVGIAPVAAVERQGLRRDDAAVEDHGASVLLGPGTDACGVAATLHGEGAGMGRLETGQGVVRLELGAVQERDVGRHLAVGRGDDVGEVELGTAGADVGAGVVDDQHRAPTATDGRPAVGPRNGVDQGVGGAVGQGQVQGGLVDDVGGVADLDPVAVLVGVGDQVDGRAGGSGDVHPGKGEVRLDPRVDVDGVGGARLACGHGDGEGRGGHDVQDAAVEGVVDALLAAGDGKVAGTCPGLQGRQGGGGEGCEEGGRVVVGDVGAIRVVLRGRAVPDLPLPCRRLGRALWPLVGHLLLQDRLGHRIRPRIGRRSEGLAHEKGRQGDGEDAMSRRPSGAVCHGCLQTTAPR